MSQREYRDRSELTAREREALECLCTGASTKEIARTMKVREATAKTFLNHLYIKLNVYDRVSAALAGVRLGICSVGEKNGP